MQRHASGSNVTVYTGCARTVALIRKLLFIAPRFEFCHVRAVHALFPVYKPLVLVLEYCNVYYTVHTQQCYSAHNQETRMSGEVRRSPRLLERMLAQAKASDTPKRSSSIAKRQIHLTAEGRGDIMRGQARK